MEDSDPGAAWVEAMLPRLELTLTDERLDPADRYTSEECREILAMLYDMDVDNGAGDLTPGQVVLQRLIMMQGWDPMTAALLSRTMPTLRWHRLELASYAAAKLLSVNDTTLLRNRREGRVPTKSQHWSPSRVDATIYWLSDVLYILAWKRQHPWSGGRTSGFPPGNQNTRS